MEASHLVLGGHLQHDREVFHDGLTNKYTLKHNDHKYTLKSLTLKKVVDD